MMKKLVTNAAFGAVLAGVAGSAQAELSGNVALTTDYVWRGVSQSDSDPAVQGGFDFAHDSGFYAGVWGSNVDFDDPSEDDADMEFDAYLGFAGELGGGFGYDVSVIRYIYPGTTDDLDWNEFGASVSYGIFSVGVAYSNDVFGSDEDGIYYYGAVAWEFTPGFTLGASVGQYDFDEAVNGPGNPDSYMDYKIGVATEYAGFGFDLSYTDTDSDGEDLYGDWADGRVVFTVSKAL